VVICAVDYRQMHIFTGKLLRCLKPAKACTDNDNLRLFPRGKLHPANCTTFDSFAPASSSSALRATSRLHSVNPKSIRGWYRRTVIKRLSLRLPELSFPPYAEAHCTQQNPQSSGETLQDHCPWKGLEVAFLATPSVVDEERKAQTPAGQSSARRRHRCGAGKGESSFRLRRNSGILA
jgi:hypothetical protein